MPNLKGFAADAVEDGEEPRLVRVLEHLWRCSVFVKKERKEKKRKEKKRKEKKRKA